METKKKYNERVKRLKALGIKPLYNSFEEKNKDVRKMNKEAREAGFARGIDQAVKEMKKRI